MIIKSRYLKVVLSGFLLFYTPVFAATTVVYRSPESASDVRYDYDLELLELALKATESTDGDYSLVASANMNFARAKSILKRDGIKNFIVKLSYEPGFDSSFSYASFPVDLGIVGYRVCFTSRHLLEELAQVQTKASLIKYSHGVGHGWSDEKILQDNGFKVISTSSYESLFHMVAANRFDLFCRGINEVLEEYKSHFSLDNFALEQSFAIYYPLPRFYYGHRNSKKLLDRIERGLKISFENGTLKLLWEKHYRKSIDFVKLEHRQLFKFENQLTTELAPDYKQYIYQAETKDY